MQTNMLLELTPVTTFETDKVRNRQSRASLVFVLTNGDVSPVSSLDHGGFPHTLSDHDSRIHRFNKADAPHTQA